jgi:hypothetical protein
MRLHPTGLVAVALIILGALVFGALPIVPRAWPQSYRSDNG